MCISWAAPAYSSLSFLVPNNWTLGLIWVSTPAPAVVDRSLTASYSKARRECDFENNPSPRSCLSGGCPGGVLLCAAPVSQFKAIF